MDRIPMEGHSRSTTAENNEDVEMDTVTRDLPFDNIIDILGRVPLQTVLRCRYVCRAWNKLLSRNDFGTLYVEHTPTILLLDVQGCSIDSFQSVRLVESGDNSSVISCQTRAISPPPSYRGYDPIRYELRNSCNGLICVCEPTSLEPLAVWNPLLGQYFILPRSNSVSDGAVVCGFGFCSKTSKYKFLRIFHEKVSPPVHLWATEVLDFYVGGQWRRIADAPHPIPSDVPGYYINDSLHWILDHDPAGTRPSDELICRFDFNQEVFGYVPPPPIFCLDGRYKVHWTSLGILRSCLSICYVDDAALLPDYQVWVMEQYGIAGSWVRKFSFKNSLVHWWIPRKEIQVLSLRKNGNIMMLVDHLYLLEYDPVQREYAITKTLNSEATAHFLGFISLKDVVNGS